MHMILRIIIVLQIIVMMHIGAYHYCSDGFILRIIVVLQIIVMVHFGAYGYYYCSDGNGIAYYCSSAHYCHGAY